MNGILCLNKPAELTSFACCARVRRRLGVKKLGHGGTLDPMATGVLPLLIGNATRAMDLLPVQDKRYTASLQFGLTSDTQDIWGTVTETGAPLPTRAAVEEALPRFRGKLLQLPPMMSALKKDGVRLYDLARQGLEVERTPRPVTIHALEILSYDERRGVLAVDCHCSKGTYVRTLCHDLGQALGCGAVMTALCRTMAAGYTLDQCVSLDEALALPEEELAARVLPVASAFAAYPALPVSTAQGVRFRNGGALSIDRLHLPVEGIVRVYDAGGTFLGLGKREGDDLQVYKLFCQ